MCTILICGEKYNLCAPIWNIYFEFLKIIGANEIINILEFLIKI